MIHTSTWIPRELNHTSMQAYDNYGYHTSPCLSGCEFLFSLLSFFFFNICLPVCLRWLLVVTHRIFSYGMWDLVP